MQKICENDVESKTALARTRMPFSILIQDFTACALKNSYRNKAGHNTVRNKEY